MLLSREAFGLAAPAQTRLLTRRTAAVSSLAAQRLAEWSGLKPHLTERDPELPALSYFREGSGCRCRVLAQAPADTPRSADPRTPLG